MKQNLPILTGLRFFAAFYVFIFHMNLRQSFDFLDTNILSIISQGAVGVNVFFILSGFILFYNYCDKQIVFLEFILKRLAKIYPVYLAGFIICFFVVKIMHIKVISFFEILIMNLLMFQSYLPKFSQEWYGSGSWSISTEFFFYLCFPLLLYFITKLSKKSIILYLILCFLCSILPGILFNLKIISFGLNYTFPPSRVWEFIIGMFTGALVFKYNIRISNIIFFVILLFSAIFFFFIGKKLNGYVIQNVIVIPIIMTILISVTTTKKHILEFLGNKFFEYLGKISYSFYIILIPIMIFLDNSRNFSIYNKMTTFITIFFANLIAAILLYHLIESPFHKFLNKKIKQIFVKKKITLI
jgi:peptidoglycan/LPS O-acetylase OafA/YrhL